MKAIILTALDEIQKEKTASHIVYTESLSSAIHTETIKVRQGVAVGGEEKLLYIGDTEFLNM